MVSLSPVRVPRRAVAAVLLGLSAAIGTVDTLAIWGADAERRLLILQLGLSLGALLIARGANVAV